MEDEKTIQQQEDRKKRLAEFERDETEILNKKTTERKEVKEETQEKFRY